MPRLSRGIKSKLQEIAGVKSQEAVKRVISTDEWMREQLELADMARAQRATKAYRSIKSGYVSPHRSRRSWRSVPQNYTGIAPRGSELDPSFQSRLQDETDFDRGFMGQPAPPDDSHPTLSDKAIQRAASRALRRAVRRVKRESPNAVFNRGVEGGDVSDGVLDAGKIEEIEETIKRILKPIAVRQLRRRADRVKRSRAMKSQRQDT